MKRAGFTMIELIFVIVILGILAAVALPKLAGTKKAAEAGSCESFYATINRTVLPAIWGDAVLKNWGVDTMTAAQWDANVTAQIAIPPECVDGATFVGTAVTSAAGTIDTVTLNGNTYDVNTTVQASSSASPVLTWSE